MEKKTVANPANIKQGTRGTIKSPPIKGTRASTDDIGQKLKLSNRAGLSAAFSDLVPSIRLFFDDLNIKL